MPLGGPSIYPAWWAQCLRRLANPVFTPLGGKPSIYPAWRAQNLSRLAAPVFTPLGGPSVYCLANPVFTPLGGKSSVYPARLMPLGRSSTDAACRAQYPRCLASPVLSRLTGQCLSRLTGQCLSRLAGPVFTPLDGPVFTPLDVSPNQKSAQKNLPQWGRSFCHV